MPSVFVGVYTAVYEYTPRSDQELALREGDVLCIIEKPDDDDWWKAKKKGNSVDDEEPVGLVPSNYIEEAKPIGKYRALFDYTAQAEEELSFEEDAQLDVYDTSDPEWALAGLNGRFGFAPANYIEPASADATQATAAAPVPAPAPRAPSPEVHVEDVRQDSPAPPSPVEAPPSIRDSLPPRPTVRPASPPSEVSSPTEPTFSREREQPRPANRNSNKPLPAISVPDYSDSDSDGPGLPLRLPGQPRYRNHHRHQHDDEHLHHAPESPRIPPGYRVYPVQEVDNKKKRAATLGLGPTGIILLPDKSSRPKEEWTIDKMVSYNYEGKHVFLEFKHPSRTLDLHAGSTERMEEIIATLGEMRGLHKAAGLDEVLRAASGTKKEEYGTVLYDFPAQGDDEVSVTVGDTVTILDSSNDEWWHVRRHVNGLEGVVPSSYIERGTATRKGIIESPGVSRTKTEKRSSGNHEVTPSGVPDRRSSLASRSRKSTVSKSKPEPARVRTWTDRSNTFKVDAQFLAVRDGKIHLHKTNGVKIAVPITKMSMQDLKYVEEREGISLDDEKPLSDYIKDRGQHPRPVAQPQRPANRAPQAGVTIAAPARTEKLYKFFLECGIDEKDSREYATEFLHNNIDESLLDDITAATMRTLGVKEGDILRVQKKLDQRKGVVPKSPEPENATGGLFSGPGGVLKNGTSRARPAPGIQTPSTVDPKAFETKDTEKSGSSAPPTKLPSAGESVTSGFDDDAWEPKPLKKNPTPTEKPQTAPEPQPAVQKSEPVGTSAPSPTPAPAPVAPALTGAMKDIASLSLSTPPLQPEVRSPPVTAAPSQSTAPQQTGLGVQFGASQADAASIGRTRPLPPTTTAAPLGIPPPPSRPLSAPQTFIPQQQPPPLMPMYTGQLPMNTGYPSVPQMGPLPMNVTGYQGAPQFGPMAPMVTGAFMPSPAPPQFPVQTGMAQYGAPQMPQLTGMPTGAPSYGINAQLPPPLTPAPRPLSAQPTGPPPPVKFGVQPKKLTPQPTGRADLSKATPENPFGF